MSASRSRSLATLALTLGCSAFALPATGQVAWGYREVVLEFPLPPLRPHGYGNTVIESGFRIQPGGGVLLDNIAQYGKHPILCTGSFSMRDYAQGRTVKLGDGVCSVCRVNLSSCMEMCEPPLSVEIGEELNDLFCWTRETQYCATGSGFEDNGLYQDGTAKDVGQGYIEIPFEVKYHAYATVAGWPIHNPALAIRFAARSGGSYLHHFDIPDPSVPRDFDEPIAASTPPGPNYTHFRAWLRAGAVYNVEVRLTVDRPISQGGPCSPPTDVAHGETENFVVVVNSATDIQIYPFQDATELGY